MTGEAVTTPPTRGKDGISLLIHDDSTILANTSADFPHKTI